MLCIRCYYYRKFVVLFIIYIYMYNIIKSAVMSPRETGHA